MNAQTKVRKGVHAKLSQARQDFHALALKKSGKNTFAGYEYFELGDFLIPALQVFDANGLLGLVSFTADTATMTIHDLDDPSQTIVLTSPMGSASLKGCHEVQNVGAVETYQRRYLWIAALEIVEHDALDATTGRAGAVVETDPGMIGAKALGDILKLLPKAGKTETEIAKAFKREQLVELTAEEADKALKRLRDLAKEPVDA